MRTPKRYVIQTNRKNGPSERIYPTQQEHYTDIIDEHVLKVVTAPAKMFMM